MTKHEQLVAWLGNRQRKYADGLVLFKELAPAPMKQRYLTFLENAPENPDQFDGHFTMLKNKLSDLSRNIATSPGAYPKALDEAIAVHELTDNQKSEELANREEKIAELATENKELQEQINELESSEEGKEEEITELKEQIQANEETIARQQDEIKALNTPGIKIVAEADLPPKLTKAYARIKEIAPLYSSLHHDIANPDIPDEERKTLAGQLCKLDDERRKLWKEIDTWAEGKTVQLETERPTFSENKIVRGIEIARQIERLKQNIQNSKGAVTRAEKEGKETIRQNAIARIERYEKELAELQHELTCEQAKG